ncbi:MAG: hypothetical protein AB1465_02560 [Patescibacteria group bacterium]
MTFPPYSKQELENKKFYQEIKIRWQKMKDYDLGGYSGNIKTQQYWWNFMKRMEETFKDPSFASDKELFERYLPLFLEVKFFLLDRLDEKEIIDLFKNHFVFAMKSNLADVIGRLRTKVQAVWYGQDRDVFLQKIRQALKENKETLGKTEIQLQGKTVKPYLQNWLLDLELSLGSKVHSPLEITNYFFKSSNVRLISQEERKLLRKIFEFYEVLKIPFNYPGSFSFPPLYMYGIEVVGKGGRQIYRPANPRTAAVWESFKKEKKEISKMPKRQGILRRPKKPQVVPPSSLQKPAPPKPAPAFAPPKKLEEGLGGKPIAKSAFSKLNSKEGLSQLSVEDFRAFSPNPREAARFIFRKIKKLILDQPHLRPQIRGTFLNSLLYHLYLSQGKEAIDSAKTISEIVKLRQEQARPHLTEEEYKAVGAIAKAI